MATNIKVIAQKTGLSISTISRALRPQTQHLVKPETRKLVDSIVQQEGYVPQRAAINLVKKRTGIVGLAIPYLIPHLASNDYFSLLVSGVMDHISRSEFELKMIIIPEGDIDNKQMNLLKARQVDGLILSGWPTINQFKELLADKIPLVVINDYDKNIDAHFIHADHFQGGYLAGKHLLEAGHKDIAMTSPEPEWFPDMDQRIEGFKKALAEAGIRGELNLLPAGVTEDSGYQAMLSILKKEKRPRAIFFQNDLTAIGALRALKEKNVKCPEEIAIMGYDDIRLSQYVSPTLSTIHQPVFEMAQEAAKLLTEIIDNPEMPLANRKHSVNLVVRESCGGKEL